MEKHTQIKGCGMVLLHLSSVIVFEKFVATKVKKEEKKIDTVLYYILQKSSVLEYYCRLGPRMTDHAPWIFINICCQVT